MFDIFKLIFTILFATYVYNNSKIGTYAKKYQPFITQYLLSGAYNIIYYYSSVEIQINRLLTIIDPYIELLKEYVINNNKNIYMIELFKDGIKTDGLIADNNNVIDKELFLEKDFDLIVISDCTKPVPINKLCINNIPNNIANYEISNARFISFKLTYDDEVVDIELNNSHHNFYVVDNVFDKSFFKYYVKNIRQLTLPIDFSYNIELIDNNINMHVLDDTYSITVYKDDYEIKKICEEDKKEEEEQEQVLEEKILQEEHVLHVLEVLEEEVLEEVLEAVLEEEVLEEEKRISSDEFVKLDNMDF